MNARFELVSDHSRKFYLLSLELSLFGPAVVRRWGRIGAAGTIRADVYPTTQEARAAYERQCERRVKRGYALRAR
jgi:predicted DNA-binding WGR domain protein